MKYAIFRSRFLASGLLLLSLCACASGPRPHWASCDAEAKARGFQPSDLYVEGPSNQVNGPGNRIYGKGNKVNGQDNCVVGNENTIQGSQNTVLGSRNRVGG